MDFEKTLLDKVDKMNDSLSTMNERLTAFEGRVEKSLTELSGKMKGNNDLISKEFDSYVGKESCETHRQSQGHRMAAVEERVITLEVDLKNHLLFSQENRQAFNNAFVSWLPPVIVVVAIVGGLIWLSI